MKYWKKLSQLEIKNRVDEALKENINYRDKAILGVPASHLDNNVFYQDAPFLKDAPFLSSLINNPNHIGCHTMGESEAFFAGTHALERELIYLLAEDVFKGEKGGQDGYVASGGTEANLQAMWIYRNYFVKEYGAFLNEICILCSKDSHYSMDKAANLLHIQIAHIPVDFHTRELSEKELKESIKQNQKNGIKYFIVVANMMTTMFGSVDDIDLFTNALEEENASFKVHVDGAFGGFIYPFGNPQHIYTFQNKHITSFTLDAHKMLQAPYGTGVFLIRKGFMKYANTEEAQYVQGLDATLIGSRSGANAISVWMIMMTYGPHGWYEKIHILQYRTEWLCNALEELNIHFYHHKYSNIVTLESRCIPQEIAKKYGLVPDTHHGNPKWLKIVVMDHVTVDHLSDFIGELSKWTELNAL